MTQNSFRKHLSMPGMLSEVRKCFDNVPDLVASRGLTLSTPVLDKRVDGYSKIGRYLI